MISVTDCHEKLCYTVFNLLVLFKLLIGEFIYLLNKIISRGYCLKFFIVLFYVNILSNSHKNRI